MSALWDKERTYRLIEKWQAAPELWNVACKEYRDKGKKERSMQAIAQSMKVSPRELSRKFHNLRCQLNSEIRKCKRMKTEDGSDDRKITWEYYEALKFMLGPMENGESSCNRQDEDITIESPESRLLKEEESSHSGIASRTTTVLRARLKKHKKSKLSDTSSLSVTNSNDGPNEIVHEAVRVSRTRKDDCDVFGEFVAVELRQIRSDVRRRSLKRSIQRLIIEMGEEEDNWDTSTSVPIFPYTTSETSTFAGCVSPQNSDNSDNQALYRMTYE